MKRCPGQSWNEQRERGSAALVRLLIWLVTTLGWRVGHVLLVPITGYFFLHARGARQNSRRFLSRALGRPATSVDVFRQYFVFASVILDRIFLLSNRMARYDIRLHGLEHLTAMLAQGRGCLLLGSHLGSFEILRAIAARDCQVPIKALMYRVADGPLTGPIERLNPALADDVIDIGALDAMLRVRDSLASGHIVGVLADRAPPSQKRLAVPFLGEAADFPTGPMILAAALEAPVVLFFGVRTGRRRYDVHFEPFADPVVLGPRRAVDLAHWVGRYAARLEAQSRAHPYNWFNLYDFWKRAPDAQPVRAQAVSTGAVLPEPAGAGGGFPDRQPDADARRSARQPHHVP